MKTTTILWMCFLGWLLSACARPEDPILRAAEAAKASDHAAYVSNFTPRSRDLMKLLDEAEARTLLGASGGGLKVLSVTALPADISGTQRMRVVFRDGSLTLPLVVHARGGQWLVDLVDSEGALTGLSGGL